MTLAYAIASAAESALLAYAASVGDKSISSSSLQLSQYWLYAGCSLSPLAYGDSSSSWCTTWTDGQLNSALQVIGNRGLPFLSSHCLANMPLYSALSQVCSGAVCTFPPGHFPSFTISDFNTAKNQIKTWGSLVSTMTEYGDFTYYKGGGVYRWNGVSPRTGQTLAFAVIGYDDYQQCWFAKTPFGTSYGVDGGYIKIGYGEAFMTGAGDNIIGITYVSTGGGPISAGHKRHLTNLPKRLGRVA